MYKDNIMSKKIVDLTQPFDENGEFSVEKFYDDVMNKIQSDTTSHDDPEAKDE